MADPATRTRASEKTHLITHQVKKKILEFLRVIMTDCLTCTSSNKGLPVIDYILEVGMFGFIWCFNVVIALHVVKCVSSSISAIPVHS